MPKGWTKANKWNGLVYDKWNHMIQRVYSEKLHEKLPTYTNVTLQLELHWLSFFVNHIKEIDGYNEEKFLSGELVLDKDIKSNGENKEYSIENCIFVTNSENSKQATKTRIYDTGENHYMFGKHLSEETKQKLSIKNSGKNNNRSKTVAQFTKDGKILIKVYDCGTREIERLTGINHDRISICCRFWEMECNKEKWYEKYSYYPYKTAGGFVWKYI